jgi:hypothetical protein
MQSHLANPTFTRISGLPQTQMDRVNTLLAARERQDREARKDCLQSKTSAAPRATWSEDIRTAYLSPRLISIDARSSWDGCSAYPNDNIPTPITIDLVQGKAIDDWSLFFKAGFLISRGNQISPLMKLYLRHVHLDKDCLDVVKSPDVTFDLWLDSRRGLMAQPSLPHVVWVCASLIAIPFPEIQDAVRDPAIREDLLATPPQH